MVPCCLTLLLSEPQRVCPNSTAVCFLDYQMLGDTAPAMEMPSPNNGTVEVAGVVFAAGPALRVHICHTEEDCFEASCRG